MPQSIVDKAKSFAEKAHLGQKRRNGDAYITHPKRVARYVSDELERKGTQWDDEIIAAAWLHDVVEDCYGDNHAKGFQALRDFGFPEIMIAIVDSVTKRVGELYADYIMRVIKGGYGPKLIKSKDLYDNTRDPGRKDKIAKYMMAHQLVTGMRLDMP